MNEKPLISIISPEYRGEKMVSQLAERIISAVSPITDNFEIILVNDASPDNTWQEIEKACQTDSRIKGVNLSRNFGQHYAITAGLTMAKGEWIVVMDCDLQDRPEEIPNLYKKALEGYDTVLAQRTKREDSLIKKLSSKAFYAVLAFLTETKQDASVANFGIYNQKVIKAILSMGDKMRYLPAQAQWVGFNKAYLPVKHDARAEGKSSYNFCRLISLALDTMLSFSDKPMHLIIRCGLCVTALSFVISAIYLIRYLTGTIEIMGYASLIISIWFLCGIIISLLGVVGLYIGKMFETVKDRPTFIIDKTINMD